MTKNNIKEIKTTLIVIYKKGIKTEDFKEAKKGLKFKKERKLKFVEQDILTFDTEEEALKVKEKLEKRKNVESVEFDREAEGEPCSLTNEPMAGTYNYHMKPNPNVPNDNFDWRKLKQINDNTTKKKDVILAVIDDGIKTDHPDLAGKLVDGFSGHYGKRQSEGGIVFIKNGNHDHGTLVTGMAVAITNNGIGASSVGGIFSNVKVLPISVYDETGKTANTSSFVDGINHAMSRGVDAINLSWGGWSLLSPLTHAFQSANQAGIACFVSSGNGALDLKVQSYYPASLSAVYAIGNVEKNITLNNTSNYGVNAFVGNGSNVIGLDIDNREYGTEYGGTSSASPHVASIYCAIKAVNPSLTRDEIINIMIESAYRLPDTHKFGNGYPNAVEAVRYARVINGEYTINPAMRNVANNKAFTITLNQNINSSIIDGVYILDIDSSNTNTAGKEHPVKIVISGSTITVTPTKNYKSGGAYALLIGDLYSTNGLKLSQNIVQGFTVK